MKTLGEKIRCLRIAAGLSQVQLAEHIEVNPKTIQRYESDEFRPDTFILSRLSAYFGVSSDYLLGLIGYKEQRKEESMKISPDGNYNQLYAQYLQCRNNNIIDPNSTYYAIESHGNKFSVQSQWIGWANEEMTYEIRQIRPIDPFLYRNLCKKICESVMVINTDEDVDVFFIFGGKALIKAEICEKNLPSFCEKFVAPAGQA